MHWLHKQQGRDGRSLGLVKIHVFVRDLLDQDPECHVGCLVHSKPREEDRRHLQDTMTQYGLEYDEARVEAIPGDVTKENLGMRMDEPHISSS